MSPSAAAPGSSAPARRCAGPRACRLAALALLLLLGRPARAFDLKLWPLIDYHSEVSGDCALHLLGPLIAYEHHADESTFALRPLFSYTQATRVSHNQLAVLYPLFVSRWDLQHTEYRLFGLISYLARRQPRPTERMHRFTIFPFVFYRSSPARGRSLSILPFYANLRDFFGYWRIRMIAFPFYLHLEQPLLQRTWLPFPFVSWTGGALGRGYRLWPLYGWEQRGEQDRLTYVLWPFYVSQERHFTRPERERRLLLFPFYASIDSASLRSRSYLVPFFTHTVDRKAGTDTWGFPWPLWVSRYDLTTGRRTGLRLMPFYEDTHFGSVHAHFVLWPLYRWQTQDLPDYRYSRSDVGLILYRNIDEQQPREGHRRRLRTLFPLLRASDDDGDSRFATPALLDALFPRNPTIRSLYAPLWQIYTRRAQPGAPPRWSVLWDLISSDGTRVRYPVEFDFSQ